jgi:CheY-like chemotaxis protein
MNLKVLSAMCNRLDFDILTAADGFEAVELVRTHGDRALCIFMDL